MLLLPVYLALYVCLTQHLVLSGKRIALLHIKQTPKQLPPTANRQTCTAALLSEENWMKSDTFGYRSWPFRDSLLPASSLIVHVYADPRTRSVQIVHDHLKTFNFAKFKYTCVVIYHFQLMPITKQLALIDQIIFCRLEWRNYISSTTTLVFKCRQKSRPTQI